MKVANDFSILSIIQGIHRATYYKALSHRSDDDAIDFIELLATKHPELFKRRSIQKAFEIGLRRAIKHNKVCIVKYLETGALFKNLNTKTLIKFFCFSILIHHPHFHFILAILESQFPHFLKHQKIKNAPCTKFGKGSALW